MRKAFRLFTYDEKAVCSSASLATVRLLNTTMSPCFRKSKAIPCPMPTGHPQQPPVRREGTAPNNQYRRASDRGWVCQSAQQDRKRCITRAGASDYHSLRHQ